MAMPAPLPAMDSRLVVMKFGGTSLADPERIRRVARRLVDARRGGARVVGVVSAMGRTTDELLALAHEVSPHPRPRELDMLVSVGERISGALVAMAISDLGEHGISLTGSQAGIVTDTVHGKARIVEIRGRRMEEALAGGAIVLVAGFQGVSTAYDVTTLGRGGSDTTAVALAAALGADVCEIHTDVEGVFTADPNLVPSARKLGSVTYEEMAELAASGARVLQLRSVEFARDHGVELHVRSTFTDDEGTWVRKEENTIMLEKSKITGVTHSLDEAVYEVTGVKPAELLEALAAAAIEVDTVAQIGLDIVFSAPLADRLGTATALDHLGATWSEHNRLGNIAVVGTGFKGHPEITARAFAALRDARVEPQFSTASPTRIGFYVPHDDVDRSVRALHESFNLGAGA
jgi:aspartate kinase